MRKIFAIAVTSLLLSSCMKQKDVTIMVQNQSEMNRTEMVEVVWHLIKDNLKLPQGQSFILFDEQGQQVPYQLVSYGEKEAQLLIFPATLNAKQTLRFHIKQGLPDKFASQAKTTFMSERKDDISWENNRVAFRMYGPSLEMDPTEPLISGGIDIWVKNTPDLVTQQWYKDDLAKVKSYHEDKGEGLDFYTVGKTLGAGAAAPIVNDSLYYINHNFQSYEILDNGPLRTVFRLTYAPYYASDSVVINETRLISLDAGSNMNKIIENYGDIKQDIQVAAGFPYYNNDTYVMNGPEGYIAYAQPAHEQHGVIYLGLVSDVALVNTKIIKNQLLGIMNYRPSYSAGKGLTYYSGGGWSKGGYPTVQDWDNYVADFAKRVRNPLVVAVQ